MGHKARKKTQESEFHAVHKPNETGLPHRRSVTSVTERREKVSKFFRFSFFFFSIFSVFKRIVFELLELACLAQEPVDLTTVFCTSISCLHVMVLGKWNRIKLWVIEKDWRQDRMMSKKQLHLPIWICLLLHHHTDLKIAGASSGSSDVSWERLSRWKGRWLKSTEKRGGRSGHGRLRCQVENDPLLPAPVTQQAPSSLEMNWSALEAGSFSHRREAINICRTLKRKTRKDKCVEGQGWSWRGQKQNKFGRKGWFSVTPPHTTLSKEHRSSR